MKSVFVAIMMGLWVSVSSAASAPYCAMPTERDGEVSREPSSVVARPRAAGVARDTNGVTILQVDPSMPVKDLALQGFKVVGSREFYAGDRWQDPDKRLRDRLLAEAGLTTFVRKWDALDRDLLFLRAQEQPIARLVQKYPGVPRARMETLISLINGEKAAER